MQSRRLLLLEFHIVERGRDENARYFPFYAGQARARGARVSWLAYGADYSADSAVGYHVRLPRKDALSLAREVRRFRPTHILSSERLSRAAIRGLARIAPGSELVAMPDFMRDGGDGEAFPFSWMSPSGPGRVTLSDIRPEYAARVMNASGRAIRGFVSIVGSSHCSARRSFRGHPFLRGIDLTRFSRPVGCTFCVTEQRPAHVLAVRLPPVREALRQLRCLLASRGRRGCRGVDYHIADPQVFLKIVPFFEGLLRMGFPAGSFYFAPRMDDILRRWRALDRLLPRLAAKGQSIHILYTGVENFSAAEQSRFNKGISAAQSVACYRRVMELKARYPRHFFVESFGFILFTPWTTLADVRRNLSVARRIGYPVCKYMLTSVVRMEPTTPMTLAARRDGLLVRRPDDAGMDYGAWLTRSWDKDLFHFRFRDPRVRVLFRALVRVVAYKDQADVGPFFKSSDRDFRRAAAFVSRRPEDDRGYLDLAETLTRAAGLLPPGATVAGLFARAERLRRDLPWRARPAGQPGRQAFRGRQPSAAPRALPRS